MHSYYVSLLTELMADFGVSEKQLRRNTSLASLQLDDSSILGSAQLDALFGDALTLSNDQQLGVKLGSKIALVPRGILGYAIITSATVGDALKLIVRYHRALLPSMKIGLKHDGDKLALVAQAPQLPDNLRRLYSEVLFGAIVTSGRILVGDQHLSQQPADAVTLELDYPAPYDSSLYHSIFGPNIQFNARRCALCFDERVLGIPISTSDHLAQEVFRRECDRLFPHDSKARTLSERVQRLLLEARSDFPGSAEVAARLHMSESTLRRRLAKEGWRFQQLLDQVRHNLANEYLQSTQLPVTEIASLLGFSDSANFRRSFKRWSNKTPSQVRKQFSESEFSKGAGRVQ